MAKSMDTHMFAALTQLRYHECPKRVRVFSGGTPIADTTRPVLVWEPRRVVPSYAIPTADFLVEVRDVQESVAAPGEPREFTLEGVGGLLDPSTSFGHHTCPGTPCTPGDATGAGFRPDEMPDLVVLDFDEFDWVEEAEPIFGHPRDPFARIDMRNSARHVRVELDGRVLAESTRPLMLFETHLPPRYYLPREDVRIELEPSATRTVCAYKGAAAHWSHPDLGADLCWSYPEPPPEMHQITDLVCFYQEKVDFVVDGVRSERPVTPFS